LNAPQLYANGNNHLVCHPLNSLDLRKGCGLDWEYGFLLETKLVLVLGSWACGVAVTLLLAKVRVDNVGHGLARLFAPLKPHIAWVALAVESDEAFTPIGHWRRTRTSSCEFPLNLFI
jgi:hypothetical protein